MSLDCSFLPNPALVSLNADVPDRDAAIRLGTSLLKNHPAVLDAGRFMRAVLHRESLQSTALPCGVALPHARSPYLQGVVLSAVRLRQTVLFDETPVRLLLVAGTPTNRAADHLALLAWLAKKIGDASVLEQLLTAPTPQAFCDCLSGTVD